jgi:hypothetical protein
MSPIPNYVDRDAVEIALTKLIPDLPKIIVGRNRSRDYDLLWKGYRFPPKVVISKAVEVVLGEPLDFSEFSGGNAPGQGIGSQQYVAT